MHLVRLLRRLRLEAYRNAIYLGPGPDPKCSRCHGHGAVTEETAFGPEHDICDCWDPARHIRIPLWFRRTERTPF
jgi:hypothetical protein